MSILSTTQAVTFNDIYHNMRINVTTFAIWTSIGLSIKFVSFSCSFQQKNCQIIGWRIPVWEILDHTILQLKLKADTYDVHDTILHFLLNNIAISWLLMFNSLHSYRWKVSLQRPTGHPQSIWQVLITNFSLICKSQICRQNHGI